MKGEERRTEGRGRRTEDGKTAQRSKKVKGVTVSRVYELPVGDGEDELILEVSRTWIPHEVLGNFDRRKLGVGVKELSSKVKDLR